MSKRIIEGYAFIIYPESCPIENITTFLFPRYPVAISPLHDRDEKDDGSPKKPHYHIFIIGQLLTKDLDYIRKITGVYYIERIFSAHDYYAYLYHWNNETDWYIPNKAQYWRADIKTSDLWDFQKINVPVPKRNLIREGYLLIRDNCISSYRALVWYLMESGKVDDELVAFMFKNDLKFKNFITDLYPIVEEKETQ